MSALRLDLDPTMGCVFIGVLFSAMLYGVTCAQVVHYSYHYQSHDKLLVKLFLLCIWTLDSVISISDVYSLWFFAVRGHGHVFDLLVFPKSYDLEYATTSVITCVAQLFYVHGIWILLKQSPYERRLVITLLPLVLSLLSLVFGLVATYITARDSTHGWIISKTLPRAVVTTSARVCAAAVADICISLALSSTLRSKMTGFKHTDSILRTLTIYIANRGILTTLVQIVLLGTFFSSINQDHMIWIIFHCAGSKIYVNSKMAVLNARRNMNIRGNVSAFTEVAI